MSGKIPSVTGPQVLRALRQDGWFEVRQAGSHIQLKHHTKPGRVTVPAHRGDLTAGTLRSIMRQAGLNREQFLQLL